MKITLIDEKGKSKTYKKADANMADAMAVMKFQLNQKALYTTDEKIEGMSSEDLQAYYIQRNYDSFDAGIKLIVNVFDNKFEAEDILRSVKRKDFPDLLNSIIIDVMDGESDEKKDDK
ncbi:phage tail assembly chaperone G [Paenilisteria newyorkensis]|uniref:phage tail assembly chaperone G n=1 Tax=Listeria newyorkensis TaxID=1497681 RepID=UPI00066A0486|nr:hypothetical protein [Listeria newyorkensis]KMT58897.1 hypothetical protein X559_2903 [Listeria newyorkensis]